jgi:hypothetical protein
MTAVRWLFHSPARLLLIVAPLVVLAVAVPIALNRPDTTQPPAATATPAQPIDPEAAEQAAEDFVATWCTLGDRTPDQWVTEMRQRSTPELGAYWTTAVTSDLSGDCQWGYAHPRWIQPQRALIYVVTKGNPVLVEVVQDGGRLLVADIRGDDQGDL